MKKIPKPLQITFLILTGFFVIGVFVVGVIAIAIGSKPSQKATENKKDKPTSGIKTTQNNSAKDLSRCLNVPANIVANINEGFNTEGLSIQKAKAVKSKDFGSVYFISGDIQGPGLEGNDEIATFATNKLDSPGIYLSVDNIAKEFSVFPDASTTDAKATMKDDGALLSRDCISI
jgi:hypothetical protein